MSSPSNNTNYQQQSALPNLPTEILLEILDKDYLEWKDYYNLRRTSSRLSHLAREPMYQGGDYCVFRMACFRGDLDTLAICAQHGAVPTQCSRKSLSDGPLGLIEPGYGLYRRNTEDDYQECWHWNIWGDGFHGPGDVVTLGFYEGNFSAERFIEVWQWLSDQGCELFTFMKLRSLVRMGFPCFSFALLSMLPTATDKAHHQGICDVIHFLYTWDLYFKGLETISQLLSILFDDMFAPWIYKGDSTRSMSDDLQAKICLLTQHQGANAFELYMLRDILAALRKIDARKESQGGLDFERDGVWCWYELCMAVSYISDEDVRKQTVDLHFTSPGDVQMIHPYLSRGWFPPSELAHARRKVLEKRALESGQKTEDIELHGQRPSTRKWAQMPLDAWDYILNWP
ncbi:F-box-like domain superfamily [Fusarium oxysporum f. sp. vasinfectum]|nr:F-box-like domain superfamily [Fusarium oxysporum f. sp. vasinfectum]